MRRHIAAFLVGAVIFPHVVSAQTLAPGTRVRLTDVAEGTRTGTVVALTPDTLEIQLKDRTEPAHVPLDKVTRLEVSRGKESHNFFRYGLAVGAGVGGVVGYAQRAGEPRSNCGSLDCNGFFSGAVVGALLGGIVGRIAGDVPMESWERVPLERRRISLVAPSRSHGHGVGLNISF